MPESLYSARNYLSLLTHGVLGVGLAAGAVMIAPVWALAAGAIIAGGSAFISIKASKTLLEDGLEPHPEVHRHSPNLGKIAKKLYEASGLSREKNPIFSYNSRPVYPRGRKAAEMFGKVLDLPNAGALNFGRPTIMATDALLELLNDDEEHAVLAHEFAHAKAGHNYLQLGVNTLVQTPAIANSLTAFIGGFAAGFMPVLKAFGVAFVTQLAMIGVLPHGRLLIKDKGDLSLRERIIRSKIEPINTVFTKAASAGTLSYLNPVYGPLWLASTGSKIAAGLISKNFSRSCEYQADRGAVALGASPLALITALRRVSGVLEAKKQEALGDAPISQRGMLTQIWHNANSSHPTVERRIARLADIARSKGFSEDEINHAVTRPLNLSRGEDLSYDELKAMAIKLC